VRLYAAKAIGKLSAKLGITKTEKFFSFVYDMIQMESSTSIERGGAAQALSEILFNLGYDYLE